MFVFSICFYLDLYVQIIFDYVLLNTQILADHMIAGSLSSVEHVSICASFFPLDAALCFGSLSPEQPY